MHRQRILVHIILQTHDKSLIWLDATWTTCLSGEFFWFSPRHTVGDNLIGTTCHSCFTCDSSLQWQLWHSNKFLSVFYLGVRLCRSFPCPLLEISMIERYSLTFWGAYNTQNILEQLYCMFWMISSTRIKGPTIIFAHILHTLCLTHLWHIRDLNQHHMSYKLVKSFLSMCTSTSVWQQIENHHLLLMLPTW